MTTKKQETKAQTSLMPIETIERHIYLLRGQKVMLDSDLAELYGVETSNLNKAVKRNIERFPVDFMFQLTLNEFQILRSQIGISNEDMQSQSATTKGALTFQSGISKPSRGGRRYHPYVFTE